MLPHTGVHVHAIATMMSVATRNAGVVGPYQTHDRRTAREIPFEIPRAGRSDIGREQGPKAMTSGRAIFDVV